MQIISEEDLEKIEQIKGKVMGLGSRGDREFILGKKGKEGLKIAEEEMAKLGYPQKYEDIEKYQWYPAKRDTLFLVLSQKIFGFSDAEMQEWGRWAAKTSFFNRLMLRFFISPERTAKESGRFWKKYYTSGELVSEEFNKKERYLILTLKDFKVPPAHSFYLEGFFYQIASYVLPKQNLKVEAKEDEKADVYHFRISW